MAVTLTRNLKLKLDSNLTANASYNLQRIDLLGATFLVDSTDTLNIRSQSDITIEPESADIGGSGLGGILNIGSSNHSLSSVNIHTSSLLVSAPLNTLDQAAGGNKYLTLLYKSDLAGPVDTTANRTLNIDLKGGDRNLILGGNLSTGGASLTLELSGNTDVFLPTSGTLATLAGTETLTNKTINATLNTLTNISNSSIANNAGITYSKLALSGGITNSDISPSAAIIYSKINLNSSVTNTDIAGGAAISRSKIASGTAAHVLINDGSGNFSSEAYLGKSRGGVGADASGISFPSSGVIVTEASTSTLTGKTISGLSNTLSNIQYGSLALAGALTNSDISSSAGIVYSKLNLNNSILNSDIGSAASISRSKLNLTGTLVNSDLSNSAAIAYSKLNISNSIVNADIASGAAIQGVKVSPDFGAQNLQTTGSLVLSNGVFTSSFLASASQASSVAYTLPSTTPVANQLLRANAVTPTNLEWATIAGTGTVTSVSMTVPSVLTVSGSPITTAGTLALDLATQSANLVLAGPSSGIAAKPTFRSLVVSDLPTSIPYANLTLTGNLVNADISAAAAISYSKLSLTGSLVNADVSNTAAIAYSKLALTGSLVDADISASAGITLSKLAALTASRALTSSAGGVIAVSAVTSTELGYVSGVTSAIQTQLDGKQPLNSTLTTLAAYNTNGLLTQTAAGTFTGRTVAAGSSKLSVTNGDGVLGNPTLDVVQTNIDHNQLLNFVANKHIDHSSVNIATSSTSGLAGGGDLTTTRNLTVDPTQATSAAPDSADIILFADVSNTNALAKTTLASVLAVYVYSTTWTTGTTKTVTHSLGTADVTVTIYDIDSGADVLVDSIVRTDVNTVTLTASAAPTGSGLKIIVRR